MKFRISMLALAMMIAMPIAGAVENKDPAELAKARADLQVARDELRDVTRRIAELSAKLGEGGPQAFAFRYLHEPLRAMVGIVMVPDAAGVRIAAVTPGGPAAKSGIRAGDVLTAVNGKALPAADKKLGDDSVVDSARALLGDLQQDQTVKLAVLRDGKRMQFELKAERRESWDWAGMLDNMPDLGTALAPLAELGTDLNGKHIEIIVNKRTDATAPAHGNAPQVIQFKSTGNGDIQQMISRVRGTAPWAAMNLSTLNPELGRYFGTDRGVLVLDGNAKVLQSLKPGDVIQIVDGQPADSVSGVMRAIALKEAGSAITIEVWRNRQRQVLTIEAPERDQFMFIAPPAPPAPPTPPSTPKAPPSPPTAPAAPSTPAAPKAPSFGQAA